MSIFEILFIVDMFLWAIAIPWPNGPGAAYPWSGWAFAWFACCFLGLAIWLR